MAALALKTLRTKAGGPMEGEKHTHDAEFGRYSGYLPDAKGSHAAVSLCAPGPAGAAAALLLLGLSRLGLGLAHPT